MSGPGARWPADAICDTVSTGATLEANGLREVEVMFRSKACLIQRDGEMADSKQQLYRPPADPYSGRDSGSRIEIHHDARAHRAPEEVVALLPGAERPTILPRWWGQARRHAIRSAAETLFWETMEKLKALRQLHSGSAD